MTTLVATTRAELLRLRRWPTLWVLVGDLDRAAGDVLVRVPVPGLPVRTTRTAFGGGGPPDQVLAGCCRTAVPQIIVQGTPMFGGAIVLILGALAAGSGYGWGTWKTAFTQGPGRGSALAGTIVSLGLVDRRRSCCGRCASTSGCPAVVALSESQSRRSCPGWARPRAPRAAPRW